MGKVWVRKHRNNILVGNPQNKDFFETTERFPRAGKRNIRKAESSWDRRSRP